jgi:lactate permease
MTAFLALLPILVILVLMLGLRWSAALAGSVGMGVALAVAMAVFAFPAHADPALTVGEALAGTGAEAGFTALTILWIIGPALGIHQLQMRTGAAEILRSALASLAPDPRILALLVAWFFVLFMEGAAGFGASVALAAPFLVAAGFPPVQAVTITLVGHVVGVSFGAIGTPIVPQVAATGLDGLELARATGPYHSLLGWVPLVVMVAMVTRSTPGGASRRIWGWTALAAACFLVPYTLLWAWVGPELPTVGGALFGGVLFVLLLRWLGRSPAGHRPPAAGGPPPAGHSPPAGAPLPGRPHGAMEVVRAAAPYLTLVGLVLATRLVAPLRELLLGVGLEWELHGVFRGGMDPLYHPGSMLLAGFLVGAWLQGAGRRAILGAFVDATRRLVPVAVALVAMLLLSRIMVHSGMTTTLAVAAAEGAGGAWPGLAPFVGVLGTFVTGSATASNILFTDVQQETALVLGLPVAGIVGAQGFGAAVGNMICPHNVVAAGATVGLAGREGEILRRTLWVTLLYGGLGGGLALWWLG